MEVFLCECNKKTKRYDGDYCRTCHKSLCWNCYSKNETLCLSCKNERSRPLTLSTGDWNDLQNDVKKLNDDIQDIKDSLENIGKMLSK